MRRFNDLLGTKVEEEVGCAFAHESFLLTLFVTRPIIQMLTVKVFFAGDWHNRFERCSCEICV